MFLIRLYSILSSHLWCFWGDYNHDYNCNCYPGGLNWKLNYNLTLRLQSSPKLLSWKRIITGNNSWLVFPTLQLYCPFTYSVLAVFQLWTLVLAPSAMDSTRSSSFQEFCTTRHQSSIKGQLAAWKALSPVTIWASGSLIWLNISTTQFSSSVSWWFWPIARTWAMMASLRWTSPQHSPWFASWRQMVLMWVSNYWLSVFVYKRTRHGSVPDHKSDTQHS